ncbi:MAG: hypothetical protein HY073_02810, partial [Deltaproteobacteria bacterium]|nr:hypothetical protein [Deltaproteobacteria bacterium]
MNSFENLSLGDVQKIDFSSSGAVLNFDDSSSHNDYLLVMNTGPSLSSDLTVKLTTSADLSNLDTPSALDVAPSGVEEVGVGDPASQFHEYLREMEHVVTESNEFEPVKLSSMAALVDDPAVGSVASFNVIASITAPSSAKTISATLRILTDA